MPLWVRSVHGFWMNLKQMQLKVQFKMFKSLKEETEPSVVKLKNYGPVYEIKADQSIDKVFEDIDQKLKDLLTTKN